MGNRTEKEFRKYLKKICNDKLLQEYVMDFYFDLANKYKDEWFTRKNFETLIIDGYEVEQDVVNELFANREQVKAEEILLYLMKNNIKIIYFFYKSRINNEVGFVDLNDKLLGIKLEEIEKFYEEPKMKKNFNRKDMYNQHLTSKQKKEINDAIMEYQKEKKNALKLAEEKRNNLIKEYLYHEMSHVFEIKTFENKKYVKNNATNSILTMGLNGNYIYCNSTDIDTKKLEEHKKRADEMVKKKQQITIDDFVNAYVINGANALSEIFNELYARSLDKKFKLEFTFNKYNIDNFIKKSKMNGNIVYNSDYDVALFVQLALNNFDEKNYRFNAKKMVEKINSLQVSKEKLNTIKNKLIKFLMQNSKLDELSQLFKQLEARIGDLDTYSTICLILGIHHNLPLLCNCNSRQNDLKVLIQDILIEAIKNNIIVSYTNQTVKKDVEYFRKINETLLKMDNFLWYPNNDVVINSESGRTKIKEINLLSIEEFVKYHKDCPHIFNFKYLLDKVKNMMLKYSDKIHNLDEIMSYFQEQKILDDNWHALITDYISTKNTNLNKSKDNTLNKLK